MPDAVIPIKAAGAALKELFARELVDRALKIERDAKFVRVPLLTKEIPQDITNRYDIRLEENEHRSRTTRITPFEIIKQRLRRSGLSDALISLLPDKWELIGDVLILKLDARLCDMKGIIAESYAEVLGAKSVLRDLGNIRGEERRPEVELIYGSDTETIHVENGIRYCLDPASIMFSSGNIDERVRMASLDCSGRTVLDMFAGIGYFSLPIAVYARPSRVYACEIRELSYRYLLRNIELNSVEKTVVPFHGDNRNFETPMPVDFVIMGYLKDTHDFLPKALSCLKSGGRIIYHENCPNELFPRRTINRLKEAAGSRWTVEVLSTRIVKSYAPGVSHVVVDARFIES
ncbi:MAG: class I SAM-dependent methyltransferase family protein [Thermoplasmata archaeon]